MDSLDVSNPENQSIRPGWKTTEFWLSTISMIVNGILSSGYLNPADPTQAKIYQILGLIGIVLTSLGYGVIRTVQKNKVAGAAAEIAKIKSMAPVQAISAKQILED